MTGRAAVRVGVLCVLSAICAELLQAYDDTTGHPAELAFAIVLYAGLYGAPALLTRELARRAGWGWPSILVALTALGLLHCMVIDQSAFSEDYRDIAIWHDLVRPTYLEPLGISAFTLQSFTMGHVVFSFGAPIALAEALDPSTAHRPWLRVRGLVLAGLAYLAVAGLVLYGVYVETGDHATPTELAVASAVVAGLLLLAWQVGRRHPARAGGSSPSVGVMAALVLAALAAAAAYDSAPSTWWGFARDVGLVALVATGLAWSGRRWRWGPAQVAAVALGAVLSRGLLAFTYYPLLGEVSAARKYSHNVVMLLVVGGLGLLACRRSRRDAVFSPHP